MTFGRRAFVILPLLFVQTIAQMNTIPVQLQVHVDQSGDSNQMPVAHGASVATPVKQEDTPSLSAIAGYDMNDPIIQGQVAEMNLGKHLYEGDIKLTQMQRDYMDQRKRGVIPRKRALVKDLDKLWEHKTIPYVIGNGLRKESEDYIKSAIDEWNSRTCLKFVERDDRKRSHADFIEFVYEGGCSSYVGRVGGRQTISCGSDGGTTCRHGNIVHEMMHSLGVFHEHSRPDRNDFIKIERSHIMDGYERNFDREDFQTVDSLGVEYDYGSIMHYGAKFFTKDKENTIKPLHADPDDIGQRVKLSELDIKQIKKLYECEDDHDGQVANSTMPANASQAALAKGKAQVGYKKSTSTMINPVRKAIKKYVSSRKAEIIAQTSQQPGLNQDLIAKSDPGMLGEMNLGKGFFEGDIKLTDKQWDFVKQNRRKDAAPRRALSKFEEMLWPKGIVPVVVDESLRKKSKRHVLSAMLEWRKKTCIKFKRKSPRDHDYVKFTYEEGCSSNVGRLGGEQTISVGDAAGQVVCGHGNVVHEIAHTLGYFHEHSRPDRDKYIKILWNNIMPSYEENFYIETDINSLGVPYDTGSVTHYGRNFFGQDGKATVRPRRKGAKIGQRKGLSELDVKQARLLYRCAKRKKSRNIKHLSRN